jgi:hypothetical protein
LWKDTVIAIDQGLAAQATEQQHKAAGKEFPQSLREEIESSFTSWLPVVRVMKLKESGAGVPK